MFPRDTVLTMWPGAKEVLSSIAGGRASYSFCSSFLLFFSFHVVFFLVIVVLFCFFFLDSLSFF